MHDDRTEDNHPNGSDDVPVVESVDSWGRQPSKDRLHDLLANERRRHLLSHLRDRPDVEHAVEELVDAVAGGERSLAGPMTHRRRVAIECHHVHLPTLADAGVIEYDPVAQTVRYDGCEALEILLAQTETIPDPNER